MTGRYPRGTAYHEAGHAVVAWSLGLQVGSIRLSDDDASGCTEIDGADRLLLVDQISVLSAGYAAERVFNCLAHEQAGLQDRAKILQLITSSGKSEKEQGRALRDQGYERASAHLIKHEGNVIRLAHHLIEHGSVDASGFLHLMAAAA